MHGHLEGLNMVHQVLSCIHRGVHGAVGAFEWSLGSSGPGVGMAALIRPYLLRVDVGLHEHTITLILSPLSILALSRGAFVDSSFAFHHPLGNIL